MPVMHFLLMLLEHLLERRRQLRLRSEMGDRCVNRLVLVGSEQTLVIDANRPRLEVYTDETPWSPPNVNPQDPMGFWTSTQQEVHLRPKTTWVPAGAAASSDAAYFLDRLDANQDSELNVAEAVHSAEVLVAAYRSAAQREVVKLPLPR